MPAKRADPETESVVKAYVIEPRDPPVPVRKDAGAGAALFETGAEISPPFDPVDLLRLYRESAHLRPPIDAIITNVESMGHFLDPVVDLSSDNAADRVREALELDRLVEWMDGPDDGDPGALTVSDDQVAETMDLVRLQQRRERLIAERWLTLAPQDGTFVELRRRTRRDLEVTGNAYWAFGRADPGDPESAVTSVAKLSSVDTRLAKDDGVVVTATRVIRRSALAIEEIPVMRRFPRFVVRTEHGGRRWFKSLGDPRVVSSATGKAYDDVDAMKIREPRSRPADEVYHFKLDDPGTPYGVPRWVGVYQAIQGSIAADEVNLDYFYAKPPPGILMVSGGRLKKETVQRLTTLWESQARGKSRFHGIVVVEAALGGMQQAMASQASGRTTINFTPLAGTQHTDALFLEYDRANAHKVGRMFRVPPILRGDSEDQNRSTADAAMAFAEEQVFQPERIWFDRFMSEIVFPLVGLAAWNFRTKSPSRIDPESAKAVVSMIKDGAGTITRNEARDLWGRAMNASLSPLDDTETEDEPEPE